MPELLEVPAPGSGAVLAATKLHIPRVRPELVLRSALIDRLLAAGESRKLTLIEAPAGYGKTTLLAEWCSSVPPGWDCTWLRLDEADNDPVRFWTGVIDALRTVRRGVGGPALEALSARNVGLSDVALPLLVNELARLQRRIVLVLDDYQAIREEEVHRSVDFVLAHLPEALHVAIASRTDPPLSLARLRAGGEMTELRAGELRFSDREATELLRRTVGVDLQDAAVARLRERTEGWPAGLYLAGLSLRGRDDQAEFIDSFAGDDRHIVDYLSSEVLARQPEGIQRFLLQTSILEGLCGPLCDAVTEGEDSGRLLEQIERRNLFLVPLDSTRTWYRYHRLFGELLRHELELSEPGATARLHERACAWYRREGAIQDSIHHAIAAGDLDQARELIAEHWNDYFNRGRLATVERWLDALPGDLVVEDPRLCVSRAWLALDLGRLEEARQWIDRATRSLGTGAGEEDSSSTESEVGVLRAVHGFKVGDLEAGRAAALQVLELAEESSFPQTVAQLILGVSLYWTGELDEAAGVLEEAARSARAGDNDLGHSYALGYLGLLEAERGRPAEAERLGRAAITLSDSPGFTEHFVLMVGHLALGRAAELNGSLNQAEAAIRRAVELGRRGAGRVETSAALLALAQVRHLQRDPDEARAALHEARAVLDGRQQGGRLASELRATERGLRQGAPGVALESPAPAEALTDRELAVLRLLSSDLSRRGIADALFVSTNTVKTHVKGIYRKLDASTRKEAVARARELGLL